MAFANFFRILPLLRCQQSFPCGSVPTIQCQPSDVEIRLGGSVSHFLITKEAPMRNPVC